MILEKIYEILNSGSAPVVNYLQTGLNEKYTEQKTKEIKLQFTKDLYDLYSWRNGTRWDMTKLGSLWLFPLGMFFNLETAIDYYSARVNKDEYWKTKMFPVFGDGGGDFFLIDLDQTRSTFGQIFYHCLNGIEFEGIISFFDSLQTGFKTIFEGHAQGAFFYTVDNDGDSVLDFDTKMYSQIGRKINPNSRFWILDQ